MHEQMAQPSVGNRPWTYLLVKWYSYIFSMFFLLYGGVNIVLGILDRDYTDTPKSLVFFILGILLITLCVGYRERRTWGWYGLVAVNALVVVWALIGFREAFNLIYLVMSLAALWLLFARRTKAEFF